MLRIFASLSAQASRSSSSDARSRKYSMVYFFRSSQLRDLSSLSESTSARTSGPNCSSISAAVTSVSSKVSCKRPAMISVSSQPASIRICATSNGCVIYGMSVPFLRWPSCAFAAKIFASCIFFVSAIPQDSHPSLFYSFILTQDLSNKKDSLSCEHMGASSLSAAQPFRTCPAGYMNAGGLTNSGRRRSLQQKLP